MKILKTSLIAPTIALILSVNLFAEDTYTIESKTLKEALQIISKQSKLPYIVDESLIENKKAGDIKDIKDLQKALNKVLKNTKLEALIKNKTIIIRKIAKENNSDTSNLGDVEVIERSSNTTEGTGSYTIVSMNTATKMNLSIKETPQSISVITSAQMKDLNIESLEDVIKAGTGLYTEGDQDILISYSRGLKIKNFQIDGVRTNFLTNSNSNNQNMDIYDRAEILRGANGLLSGTGNPSATINLVRKKADSKDFKGSVELAIASFNKKKVSIDVSSALNENGDLRGRFVASKESKKGFKDFEKTDRDLLFGTFEKDISDNTLLTLGASYQKVDKKGIFWGMLPGQFSDGSLTNWDRSKSVSSPWAVDNQVEKRYFTKFDHTFNNSATLNLSYSYSDISGFGKMDYISGDLDKNTGLGLSRYAYSYPVDETKEHLVDISTSIPFEFNNFEHEFVTGLSYSKKKAVRKAAESASNNVPVGSYYDWKGLPEPIWKEAEHSVNKTQKQIGFFAASKLSLREDLKIIVGARLTKITMEEPIHSPDNKPFKGMDKNISPYLGIVYNLNENHTLYASYTDIFTPQTERNTSGETLKPIIGSNLEIGSKASYFDDKLNFSFSLFRIKQDNLAQKDGTKKVLDSLLEDAYYSADGVISKGFEAELSGEVTENINLSLGVSSFIIKDNNGKKINKDAPNKHVKFNTKYKYNKYSIGGGFTWQGKRIASDDTKTISEKAYFLANLMGKYDFTKDLSLQVNISNVFDKKYYGSVWSDSYSYGEPRKISAKLTYKF